MFLIWNGHAAVLLFALTQSLVVASLDHVEDTRLASAEMIDDCVRVSWMGGLDWVIQSPESSRAEKVRTLIRGIESGEIWALQMLDTLLKFEREIPERKIQDIRIDDKYVEVHETNDHVNVRDDSCAIVSFGSDSMTNGRNDVSTCNSSSDNKTEVTQIVHDVLGSESMTNKLDLEAGSSSYVRMKSDDFTTVEIYAMSVFLTIGAFVIACTICDIVRRIGRRGNCSTIMSTLSRFSLYTNALAILSTEVTPHMMPAMHGIRCLGCFWIIFGHHCLISMLVFARNTTILDVLEGKNSIRGLILVMAPYSVDTFLLISGFFLSYWFFKSTQSGTNVNWPMLYLSRYLRITPCIAALILFTAVLSHRAGSGPLWEAMFTNSVDHCQDSWWLYLLHIQNLVTNGGKCIPHGWYLALNMQLFWISPVILHALHHRPKFGLGLLSLLFVASVITPAIIIATNGYSNAVLRLDVDLSTSLENFENLYIPSYTRASTYLAGILLGYEVAKKRRNLTQVNVAINWLVAGILILFCTWSTNYSYNSNFAYSLKMEIAFALLLRPCWSIAIAWIIYACTQGYGGLATRFLSLPIFFPLSRLAYCLYLVHLGIQAFTLSRLQAPANFLGFEMVFWVCCDLVISISVAFVLSLFIEYPFIALTKIPANYRRWKTDLLQEPQKTEKVGSKTQ